jgi:cation:H+ antiporter
LIAGLTQTIRPSKKIEAAAIRWRGIFFFAVLIGMNLYAYLTQKFNRPAGIVLILLFAVYAYLNIKKAGSEGEESENEEDGKKEGGPIWKHLLVLVVCAVFLYFGANLLVDNGILIAEALGVPERVIAVTFIALGTSLPELVTSLVSIIKGYGNVGLGNIVGANILNMLLVIGIPSAIAGIPLERSTVLIDMPLALLVMAVLLIPILIRKKSSRVQGIALLAIYAAYCVASFI